VRRLDPFSWNRLYADPLVGCTRLGGQVSHGLLDSLTGELLFEMDRAAVAKGGVQPLGIVDLLDEARSGRGDVLEGLVLARGKPPRP
jgi:hypothetical protein